MNSKIKNMLPLLFLILMVLIIIPQSFATDLVNDDNNQIITNDMEEIIINDTTDVNDNIKELSLDTNNKNVKSNIQKAPEGDYWIMTMNPTEITYNSESCTVDVTIQRNGFSAAADLYYWIDGVKTTYAVYQGSGYTKAQTNTDSFTIDLTHMGTSNLFESDGTYEVSLRPDNGADYFGFTINGITPEFGTVTVTVGNGGSSTKTATTLTVNTESTITEGTDITGTLMAGTTPIIGATINYKFEGTSKTTTTTNDGSFTISTDYATGKYSDFSYDGDNTYESSSSTKTITVNAASLDVEAYITTPSPNSISYTKGTSTKVTVTIEYPDDADTEWMPSKMFVFIDPTDTSESSFSVSNGIEISGVSTTGSSFEFDLETIKDSLTDGTHTLYFGPNAGGLSGAEIYDFDYKPLTVTVSGSSSGTTKTTTILTIDNEAGNIYTGSTITGTLTDANGNGINGATINYKESSNNKEVTTGSDGKFTITVSTWISITYSDFEFEGDTTYEGSTNSKTFTTVSAPKTVTITATPTTATYTAGTSSEISVTLAVTGGSPNGGSVAVWVDDDTTNYVNVHSLLSPGTFTIDLNNLKDTTYNIDLSSVLASGSHTLHVSVTQSTKDNTLGSSWTVNDASVTVTADSSSGSDVTDYTTTPSPNTISYTKGTSTKVTVTIEYPNDADTEWMPEKMYVFIDPSDTTSESSFSGSKGIEISGVSTTGSSFEFDLETIKDSLTDGTHTLYFGPNAGGLQNAEIYGFDYKPLTVTVSGSSSGTTKTTTTLTVSTDSSITEGTDITGTLKDANGNGISDATITYKLDGSSKSTTTSSDGSFTISTTDATGVYSDFAFAGDSTYDASSSSKTVTVSSSSSSNPQFIVTISETSVEFTPGTDCIIHGTITYPNTLWISSLKLFGWFDDDLSTQEKAWDEEGYAISVVNGDFTVNLNDFEFKFKSGKSYKLTLGCEDGASNSWLAYDNVESVLDSITINIPASGKTSTDIILDEDVVVEGSVISGKLVDDNNNPLSGKTITAVLKLPSGSTESPIELTTSNDGTFKVSNAKVGVYTFTFAEDSSYEKAESTVTVTYANKKIIVSITEDSVTYKKGEDTILHGTISGVDSYMFYSGDIELYVWVNGDLSTQEIVYDEDGYKVDMSNGAFTANLKLIDFNFEVGETYTLTFGPKDGVNNAILISGYYLYSADLDNVTVKVTDKNPSKITLDETSIKATQDITGKLTDNSDTGIASATIKFVKPNGASDTVTTGSDGTFTISSAIEGTYSNFEFEGDTTYEGVVASSNVTVSGPEATTLIVNKIDDTVFVGKTITGMLTDSEGTGIADAVIKYTGPNGADTVTTDSTGAFTISNVKLGEYKDFSFEATIDYQAASVNGAVTVISTPTYNGIIYVSKSGSDSNEGSESSPVATIAKAIELAEYTLDHKIIVSAGTYREHDLSITDALSITGVGNVIIDANKQGKIFNIDTTEEVSLTNLTLINGKSTTDGGAISIKDAKVSIDGLTFRNNDAFVDNDGVTSGVGGAIYWNANNGVIKNSVFKSNTAKSAGAISFGAVTWGASNGDDCSVINCTFEDNVANGGNGGAIVWNGEDGKIINSIFTNNSATGLGAKSGAVSIQGDNFILDGSTFTDNSATGYGGAIEISAEQDGCYINNTKFINNEANAGGAIEVQSINPIIANSTFINNHATYDGGAIDLLLSMDSDEGVFINNNIFESNVADNDGGAISIDGSESYSYDGGVFLEENTFTKNSARNGGAISADSNSVLDLKNNEFTSNVASVSGGAIKDGKLTLEGNTANDNEAPVGACIYLETGSIESDVTLTYSSISALSGDTITLTAILTDDNGNSIVLDGNSYYPGVYFTVESNDVSGTLTYNSENMTIEYEVTQTTGDYTISGSVDSDFADSVTVVDGTLSVVEELETVLTVENQTINYGTSFTGTLTDINGKPLAGKEITYTYKGNTLTVTTDDEGVFTISSAREGTYSDFAFAGDDSYTESTSDAVVTVREQVIPAPTIVNVTITDSSLTVNNGTVSVHVSPSDDSIVNSGSVSLTVDGVTYSSNVTNGVATFNLNLTSGNYSALVDYIAIGNYSNASKNLTVIVPTTNNTNDTNHTNVTTNVSTIITLEFEELETGHEICGKLTDANGNLLNGNVDIALSRLSSGASKTYTVTCTNGEFVLPLHLAPGDYSAQATYNGEGNYLPNSTGTKYIALTDKPSNVILDDSDEVTGVYGENNTFGGVLTDKDGNAFAGYHVALNITRLSSGASKIYYVTTDYNGNYVLPINLAPGYYTVRTTIDDKNYTGASLSSLIIRSNDSDVDNRSETIINIVSSVINYTTGGNLSGKLLNTAGYGIAGQHVDVTLANSRGASKTYNLVTDYTGSFNLPINLARGSYTAVCTYDGTATYAPSKTGTITVSVI